MTLPALMHPGADVVTADDLNVDGKDLLLRDPATGLHLTSTWYDFVASKVEAFIRASNW